MSENQLQSTNQQSVSVTWIPAEQLTQRINRMVEVQKKVMKNDVHYGIIPGCQKPSLYKPGAQLLCMTFQVGSKPCLVEDLSSTGEKNYRVTVEIFDQKTGNVLGYGIGECSSMEDKYAWRKAVCEEEFKATPDHMRREKFFKGKGGNGHYTVQQIRTNPHDVANTVLKMAEKRAFIDGALNVLSASEVFTQDIEDLPEGYVSEEDQRSRSSKPSVSEDDVQVENNDKPNVPTEDQRKKSMLISENQAKRIYAICKSKNVTPESVLAYLKIESFLWITYNKSVKLNYESICKTIEEKPEFFAKYQPQPKEKKKPVKEEVLPEVMGDEDFLKMAKSLAESAGMSDIQLNSQLEAEFSFKDLESVPADSQSNVIDWLTSLQDTAGA